MPLGQTEAFRCTPKAGSSGARGARNSKRGSNWRYKSRGLARARQIAGTAWSYREWRVLADWRQATLRLRVLVPGWPAQQRLACLATLSSASSRGGALCPLAADTPLLLLRELPPCVPAWPGFLPGTAPRAETCPPPRTLLQAMLPRLVLQEAFRNAPRVLGCWQCRLGHLQLQCQQELPESEPGAYPPSGPSSAPCCRMQRLGSRRRHVLQVTSRSQKEVAVAQPMV